MNTYVLYKHTLCANVKMCSFNAEDDRAAMLRAGNMIKDNSRAFVLIDHHRNKKLNYRDGEWL